MCSKAALAPLRLIDGEEWLENTSTSKHLSSLWSSTSISVMESPCVPKTLNLGPLKVSAGHVVSYSSWDSGT